MPANKQLIGLTGPSGSGKSAVCDFLRQKGYPVLDCDKLARAASERGTAGLAALIAAFGSEFLTEEGELNRRKLGAYVFADKERVKKLNAVTHPYILALIDEQIAALPGDRPIFLDAPTLFQSGLHTRCAHILLVTAEKELRRRRIMERDGLTFAEAEARMGAQLSDEELASRCDLLLENNGTLAELNRKTEELLSGI